MSGPARWSSPASLIRLEGPDARRFLHGQSSQAIELAPPGSCLATCLISPTARLRALALVRVDASGADLVVIAGDGAAVHQALDRVLFPADQVRLGPVEAITLVRLLGATGATETAGETSALRPPVNLGGGHEQPVLLLRQGDSLPTWAEALPELSAEQAELQRLRAGFPAAPGELNDGTNPFELGLANWVSLSKGCYVGQETLAKLATYDGVKQQLRHWRAGRTGPAAADALSPGTPLTTAAGERAGVITSTLAGPDGVEGLALVRRQALAEPQLLAGNGAAAVPLELRLPEGFVAPPVGAGGSSGTQGG
jgi:folate-binding protein YgfZ